MKYLILLVFCLSFNVTAYEQSDAFIVRVFDKHFKVLSPPKYLSSTSVIVENKTMTKLVGKLETEGGQVLKHMAIKEGKHQAVVIQPKKGERLFFVPLAPPFQKVELVFGQKPYEIPPQK